MAAATVLDLQRNTSTAPEPPAVIQQQVSIGLMNLNSFELSKSVAKVFSESDLVPQAYRKNMANCVIALNMAARMNADPLMIMQNLYLVQGRPAWSSQFLIATFNQCGRFTSMRFEFKGEPGKDDYGCRAYATERATGNAIKGAWIDIAMAKKEGWYQKNGSKWQTMPEQMLMYRAASFLVRTHAPELSMGLQTAEEAGEIVDMKNSGGTYVSSENINDADALSAQGNTQPSFDELCSSIDIDREIIDQFVGHTAVKNKSSNEVVRDQAAQNWDRFVKALRKFAAKQQAQTPVEETQPQQPVAEEIVQQPKGNMNGGGVPISFTREYKDLMALGAEFPEAYNTARKNTGLKPDSVENCITLIASTKETIDVMNSDQI